MPGNEAEAAALIDAYIDPLPRRGRAQASAGHQPGREEVARRSRRPPPGARAAIDLGA
jgi:hypothetical protein